MPASLADFIDEQSAFLVQKAIYEYSRARAGHYAKVLFAEHEFREAVEQSRWRAYPARTRDGGGNGRRRAALAFPRRPAP